MDTQSASPPLRGKDAVIIVLICVAAALTLLWITTHFRQEIIQMSIGGRWFQSDGWRVYDDMTSFEANHYRNSLRPLFSLLSIPITGGLASLFDTKPIESIWLFNGILLSAWCSGIYVACRLIGVRIVASLLLAALALSSAATVFWFTVPETYGLSSLSLVCAVVLAAVHVRRPVGNSVWIAVGTLLAGTLITNWATIVVLSFILKPRKDAVYISAICLFMFFGAWAVQKAVFPKPGAFPLKMVTREKQFVLHADQGGVGCTLAGEFIHPLLVPPPRPTAHPEPTGNQLTVQCENLVRPGVSYGAAVMCWLVLLAWGIHSMAKNKSTSKFLLAMLAILSTQVALHLIYGEETFLYALHFSPFLIVLSAGIFVTNHQKIASWLLAGLVIFAAFNNATGLATALTNGRSGALDVRIVDRHIL